MTLSGPGPTSHIYFSQRMRLHYVDWGNPDAPPVLLIHGGRDHCRNWDWVAERLRDRFHLIAPDLRGHGDSQWLFGASYSILDFAYDMRQLVRQTRLAPLTVIGHSLGGSIALHFAGLYPELVSRVAAIEGLGPSPQMMQERRARPVHDRIREWMDDLHRMSSRIPRRYASLEEALSRMQSENPHLSDDQARHLTIHGSTQNEDGSWSWKFDNYVRSFSPVGLSDADSAALWNRIDCLTLLVRGTESWASDPATDGRGAHFRHATIVNIEDAGHWVHHDQLDVFMGHLEAFLA